MNNNPSCQIRSNDEMTSKNTPQVESLFSKPEHNKLLTLGSWWIGECCDPYPFEHCGCYRQQIDWMMWWKFMSRVFWSLKYCTTISDSFHRIVEANTNVVTVKHFTKTYYKLYFILILSYRICLRPINQKVISN